MCVGKAETKNVSPQMRTKKAPKNVVENCENKSLKKSTHSGTEKIQKVQTADRTAKKCPLKVKKNGEPI